MAISFKSVLAGAQAILQNMTKAPKSTQETYYPDQGYDGFESFTVEAIPSEYVIPTDITPSNDSPVSLASGSAYKPDSAGYAIASYSSITPSTSGTSFTAGIKKMASSGYAYSTRPSLSRTQLWINSNPSTNFCTSAASTKITVSNISSYSYIEIVIRLTKGVTTTQSVIMPIGEFRSGSLLGLLSRLSSSSSIYVRYAYYESDTTIWITPAYQWQNSSNMLNSQVIPYIVYGLK